MMLANTTLKTFKTARDEYDLSYWEAEELHDGFIGQACLIVIPVVICYTVPRLC